MPEISQLSCILTLSMARIWAHDHLQRLIRSFAIVFPGPGLGVPDQAAALGRRQLDSAGVKPNLVKTETKKEQRRIRTRVVKKETAAKRKSTMIVNTNGSLAESTPPKILANQILRRRCRLL